MRMAARKRRETRCMVKVWKSTDESTVGRIIYKALRISFLFGLLKCMFLKDTKAFVEGYI